MKNDDAGVLNLITRIGQKERKLSDLRIISPVCGNRQIATWIEGIIYRLNIARLNPGWYRFQSVDFTKASAKGTAELSEVETYLRKLPRLRMVLVQRENDTYWAMSLKQYNLDTDLCPVLLVDNTPMDFDTVLVRFDGARLWYQDIDPRNDPQRTEYLRHEWENHVEPDKLRFSGMVQEERLAYALRFQMDKEMQKKGKEARLRTAVEHGGGSLVSYIERADHFSVTYTVDGRQYTSRVTKDDSLSVLSAGICLNGQDTKFDLKSLIPVLKEGHRDRHYFEVFNPDDPNDDEDF